METDRLATHSHAVRHYQCCCQRMSCTNGIVGTRCSCSPKISWCISNMFFKKLSRLCIRVSGPDLVLNDNLWTMSAALTSLALSDPGLSPDSRALYLFIYLFTVQVKELSTQVCHYTQGIRSYINPLSNEAEMAAYLLPLSLAPFCPSPQVIPLIRGWIGVECVCVLDYWSWFSGWRESRGGMESGGGW